MKKMRFLFTTICIVIASFFLVSCVQMDHEHDCVKHEQVDATCTENGTIAYYECQTCYRKFLQEGMSILTDEEIVIPAKGHQMVEHEAVGATCTETGSKAYYECKACDKYFVDAEGSQEYSKEEVIIAANGHSMVEHEAVEATCTEAGNVHYFECTSCGEYYEDEAGEAKLAEEELVVAAKGHSMTEHTAVESSCTEAGNTHYFECTSCDKYFEDEEGKVELAKEEVVVAAKGHSMTEHAAVEATCTEAGSVHYFECTSCGKYYEDEAGKVELAEEELVVAAKGHSMTEHAAVEPSCEAEGNVHYFACTPCGKFFADAEGKTEITEEELALSKVPHSMTHYEAVQPVVGTPGNVEYYGCSICNKAYADEQGTTVIANTTNYAYLVTKEDAHTAGYQIDYTDSKYTFVDSENTGSFVSNNKGVSSQTSYMHLEFKAYGVVSFDYSVSSESGWDKFTIYASNNNEGYRAIVSGVSGINSGSITLIVTPGDYIYFQYSKDSSGNKNDDISTVSNIVFVTTDLYEKATVSFNVDGGKEIAPISVYKGVEIVAPEAEKEGYFFDGWYADEKHEVEFNFKAGLSGDTTVYAKYTKGVVVSYANTGHEEVESVLVRPNTAITAPEVIPTSDTQYFNGWYVDAEGTVAFNFEAGVSADTVVYAGWRNPVVVSFVTGTEAEIENVYTDINVAIELPTAPEKVNYRFDGWCVDEACQVPFDAEAGVVESTVLYAKWVEQVTVSYVFNGEVVGTEVVDINSAYTASTPSTFDEIVLGWYTDAEKTQEFVDGTVVTEAISLHAKIHTFAPEGVLESFENGDGSSNQKCPWVYDYETNSFTSSNKGIGSSSSVISMTFAKESFVSFSYTVNSESNYDYIIVKVNGTQVFSTRISGYNGKDVTGTYTNTFNPGDVFEISYKKDNSGNQGADTAIIKDLIINDGVPSIEVVFNYQEEGVENQVTSIGINETVSTIANFDSYTPVDTDARHFGGWYYDAECTKPVSQTDVLLKATTFYAKYIFPAVITFDTDGAGEIAPISVWTGIDITDSMPANPSKSGYIFRCWLDENADPFDPTHGVSVSMLLTAYFEELPVGATVEEALVATLTEGKFNSGTLRTNEEFQNFYVVFTPEVTDFYYFVFSSDKVVIEGGSVSYTSYRRFSVVDSEGNTVVSSTSSDTKVELEAGVTYVVTYNLGYSTYTAWGQFEVEINSYPHDNPKTEAIPYEFGTEVVIAPQTFTHRQETMVYEYTATTTKVFALHVGTNDWTSISVYSDQELKTRVVYKNVSTQSVVVDFPVEEGTTYYMVFSINWTASEILVNSITFSVVEYPQGYDVTDPYTTNVGDVIEASFASGANTYYQVEVAEAGTYNLAILTNSDSNSKTVELYAAADLTTPIVTVAGAEAISDYVEELEAGTYIIKAYNTSSSYNTSFTASLTKVAEGAYWSTAVEVELGAANSLSASETGYYYAFETGAEKLWYFVETEAGTAVIYNSSRAVVGTKGIQLEAATKYYLVVTSETETVNVTVSTLVEYADGKSPAGAFTYSVENSVLDTAQASYTVYYKVTVEEAGTYRFYSNNSGTIDTKGYLYSDAEFKTQIKYNDDGQSEKVNAGFTGYKYDFYFEQALEAGTTYYLKVTYTVNSSNVGVDLSVNVVKAE